MPCTADALSTVELRDFRCYEHASVELGERLTVVHGDNGAGKSSFLEAICFALTGRSPRTRNDRELVRFGAAASRVRVELAGDDGERHELSVGFGSDVGEAGLQRRLRFDGATWEKISTIPHKPLVIVFAPDRLELINGPPAIRRAHLDHLTAALWPVRGEDRVAYARALAQRNGLLGRIRARAVSRASAERSLATWDAQLVRHAVRLTESRSAALDEIAPRFAEECARLGLTGAATIVLRGTRSSSSAEDGLRDELSRRLQSDIDRGFTSCGPHRDEVVIARDGRPLRAYGSQGERRIALLALLLSERAALGQARGQPPLILLDDVMSELDLARRDLLTSELTQRGGQSVIATADIGSVPESALSGARRIRVGGGSLTVETGA